MLGTHRLPPTVPPRHSPDTHRTSENNTGARQPATVVVFFSAPSCSRPALRSLPLSLLSLSSQLAPYESIHPSIHPCAKKIFCTAPCGLLFRRTAHRSRPTTDYFFAISTTPLSLLHMPSPLLYVLASHLEPEEERSNSFLLRAH